jgi:beta-phosphoglucomutase-like phosphatase (HAD superfamily)
MLRAIVFDFDGVILESADIKTNAFRALFASYPEHVDQIVDFHLRNAGVSR